jgi:hypothetical protein
MDPGPDPHDILSPCDLSKPFGARVKVEGLDDLNALGPAYPYDLSRPSLTTDELTIVVTAGPTAQGGTAYIATRSTVTGAFGNLQPLVYLVGQDYGTATPSNFTISGDGLTLYFMKLDRVSDATTFEWATRQTRDDLFTLEQPPGHSLPNAGDPNTTADLFLSADAMSLYYYSDALTFGKVEGIYQDDWSSSGWGYRRLVRAKAQAPVVSADGLMLYFTDYANPNYISIASRATTTDAFTSAAPIPELSDPIEPGWLSSDGCRLYFVGVDGAGDRAFVARRGR